MMSTQSKYGMIALRIPREEYEATQRAAQEAGESLSEYVRKAVMARRGGSVAHVGQYVSSGTPYNIAKSAEPNEWTTGERPIRRVMPQNVTEF